MLCKLSSLTILSILLTGSLSMYAMEEVSKTITENGDEFYRVSVGYNFATQVFAMKLKNGTITASAWQEVRGGFLGCPYELKIDSAGFKDESECFYSLKARFQAQEAQKKELKKQFSQQ